MTVRVIFPDRKRPDATSLLLTRLRFGRLGSSGGGFEGLPDLAAKIQRERLRSKEEYVMVFLSGLRFASFLFFFFFSTRGRALSAGI